MNEGDDAHLCLTLGTLKWVDLINALYARGPTTLTELLPIITLWFFSGRRGELSAFTSAPAGIPSIVPGHGITIEPFPPFQLPHNATFSEPVFLGQVVPTANGRTKFPKV